MPGRLSKAGQTSLVSRQLNEQQHTHKMLPKNYSLRKILVVFSFFEIFCTRVGNSERFSQGKMLLQFSTQMQNDEIRCVGCVVCCSSSSIVLPYQSKFHQKII